MKVDRRSWVIAGGLGVATGAAGLGWAVWRERTGATASGEGELWASSFDAPDGSRVQLSTLRGAPLVLNFWATWCPPCVREMPALDRFAREFAGQGWRVLGLAADNVEPVRSYLARSPVSYAVALTGFDGIELSRRLGNTSGGLPFTVLFDRSGKLLHRRIGETSYEQLAVWATGIG